MSTVKPACKVAIAFVKHHHTGAFLAPLTGQDARAFAAFAHLCELYFVADADGRRNAVSAMASTLLSMQACCWVICKSSIPALGDWSDEGTLWKKIIDEVNRSANEASEGP